MCSRISPYVPHILDTIGLQNNARTSSLPTSTTDIFKVKVRPADKRIRAHAPNNTDCTPGQTGSMCSRISPYVPHILDMIGLQNNARTSSLPTSTTTIFNGESPPGRKIHAHTKKKLQRLHPRTNRKYVQQNT
jgi:hypothetical protein